MKTIIDLANSEINELEHAVNNASDMKDYVDQFAEYTAKDMLHILKSLVAMVKKEEVVKRGESQVA